MTHIQLVDVEVIPRMTGGKKVMMSDPTQQSTVPKIEETFAVACGDLGGPLVFSSLPGKERDSFLSVQRSFQGTLDTFRRGATRKHGQPSEWYIGFVDSMDINAFATKVDRSYLVGINKGTIDRSGRLFLSIFVNVPRTMGPFRKLPGIALGSAAGVLTLDYVFLHELAHASLGHLDYLESMGLAQRLREVDTVPAGLPIALFQAMELQADYFAGVQLADAIIRPRGRYLDLIKKDGHDELSLFSLAVFAMALLGHILNQGRRELEAFDSADHPHPEVRLSHFIGGLEAAVNHLQPNSLSVLARAARAAVDGLLPCIRQSQDSRRRFPSNAKGP